MLDFSMEKSNCTGCTACLSACPIHCIKMEPDDEGFLYPSAGADCVKCGKCKTVCPQMNLPIIKGRIDKVAYAGITHNKKVWRRSASGGAFSEICKAWGNEDGIFVGAKWDGLHVVDACITGISNINVICKSKYIASDLKDVFIGVKEELNKGRNVVFCGTPCQVAGLRNFLGSDYDNILFIDLICHGVGSQEVFNTCIDLIGEYFSDRVIKYEFRAKRRTHETDYLSKVSFQSGKDLFVRNDQYIQLFLSQSILRPCCVGNCKYRNPNRMGDITIGDFKGLGIIFPELVGEKRNYSTIVINTEKGKRISENLKRSMKLLDVSIAQVVQFNPLFDHDTNKKNDRYSFFELYKQDPFNAVKERTTAPIVCRRTIKKELFDLLPIALRSKMRKFRGKT